ncbi:MAG: DUF3179 domain-containing (seleno)protein [bacterium]|nr:DUF3179 domain-containing (seleno)protein [bacterium]
MTSYQKRSVTIALITFVSIIALIYLLSTLSKPQLDDTRVNGLLPEVTFVGTTGYRIPPQLMYANGLEPEDDPTLIHPAMLTTYAADSYLDDTVQGIVVEYASGARFYPYQIMNYHSVIMDEVDGGRYAITHSNLCLSDNVFDVSNEDDGYTLESSGMVYENNILLRDNISNALWSQLRGEVLVGDEADFDRQLIDYPSLTMTWENFKATYPSGLAVSNETEFVRDYSRHPLGAYDTNEFIYFPVTDIDTRVPYKWPLEGISVNDVQTAFPYRIMIGIGAANEDINGLPIAAFYDPELDLVRIFDRALEDGTVLTFSYDFVTKEFRDNDTNSLWSPEGLGLSGEYEGVQLTRLESAQSFWLCWSNHYPETGVSKLD